MTEYRTQKRKKWYRLDNAAKMIPSTTHFANTRVFRICCELHEEVDEKRLQDALDRTVKAFPYFNSVLRKGFFWYYLEESDKKAVVRREDLPACHSIYSPGRKNLLYRVNYFGKRVNLEMYHVLTDGTGALVFFRRMITYYLILSHPELGDADDSDLLEKYEENVGDAFDHYYTKGRGLAQLRTMSFNWAFRLRGAKDPNMENHLVEGVISSADFVRLAHQYNTTVGVLSVALYIEAIMDDMNMRERARKKITISVPVNLRQFFPSDTNRNFFGVITISYLTKDYTGELESIIDCVRKAFEYQLSQERVTKTMSSYSALEHNVPIKVVPLVLKDLVVQGFATASQMGVTCSVSNLGRIAMPDQLAPYINYFSAFTTASSAQITIATYRDKMTFGWASAITTHQVMRAFYRKLAERGIEAVVATNDHDAETIVQ
ncbi:MAG: hypothetical protein K6C95_07915 [Lachnospiraceae bacterium]|nr:hypothetical protein [Lachnospiraceae bacterium]